MKPLLEVKDFSLSYEGQVLFKKLAFSLAQGELLLVHGAKASGKSSFLEAIMGMANTANVEGQFVLQSRNLNQLSIEQRAKAGLAFIPEKRPIFPELTVWEHLKLSASHKLDESLFSDFPILSQRRNQLAGTLSGGEQTILSCAMVQQRNPTLILWDMPLKGLSADWVRKIFRIIQNFKNKGIPLLMAVQNPASWQEFTPRLLQLENS